MLKVLIVDDEPIMLEGLRLMVDWPTLGFDICGEALDGEDALQLMSAENPHLVITDVRMPVIDGLQLIERASVLHPRTKFIILSGYADFQYAKKAMKYGVSNYLTKPLDETELQKAVQAAASIIQSDQATLENQRAAEARIQTDTITRLLLGDGMPERAVQILQLHEESKVRCVQLIAEDASSRSLQEDSDILQRIRQLEASAPLPDVKLLPFQMGKGRSGFVLATFHSGISLLPAMVNEFLLRVRSVIGEEIAFSVSSEHKGMGSLREAYLEVLAAEMDRFPSQVKGIHYYQDKQMEEEEGPIPRKVKESLLQAIVCGHSEEVRSQAHRIIATLSMNTASEAWIGACLSTIKLEALQQLIQHGANVDSWTKQWFMAPSPLEQGGWGRRLINELVEAAEWFAAEKGARVDTIVSAAAEYIRNHYSEKLQLQHVAEQLHVNPAYLGQRFKKQLGTPFNEYLHTVRIEEAKKQLRRAELKISDVASRVGYSDTEQFVAKFKALTGMLPSAYKKG